VDFVARELRIDWTDVTDVPAGRGGCWRGCGYGEIPFIDLFSVTNQPQGIESRRQRYICRQPSPVFVEMSQT